MSDILCVYYSRTGKTRAVMQEIAQELGAEGYLMCGIDAMRRGTHRTKPYHTEKDLEDYKLVILGTPIWAGRCSSVIRGFLKRHGLELKRVAYVLTRDSEKLQRDVMQQMDLYTAEPHLAGISLRYGFVGYHFWRDQFLTNVRNLLANIGELPPVDKTVTDFAPETKVKRRRRSKKEAKKDVK